MNLSKATRKQLAERLYDLYLIRGICSKNGCGKTEWVKRTLKGCGACKPMNKNQLLEAVVYNESL